MTMPSGELCIVAVIGKDLFKFGWLHILLSWVLWQLVWPSDSKQQSPNQELDVTHQAH
jgi:hypothetical protein